MADLIVPGQGMATVLTDAEHATILGALRLLQEALHHGVGISQDIQDVMTNSDTVTPLSAFAIDDLCEKLNQP